MLIQTLNRRFEVIVVLRTGHDSDVYVCRDLWEEKERKYLLAAIKNPDLVYRCIPYFSKQADNRPFKDFVECFSRDGLFYVVFAYYAKPLLKAKFGEELYFLNERLEIGKNLLSRIILQQMPPAILYEALQDRNLLLDEALQVYFNYILEEIPAYGQISLDRVQIELGRIFRFLLRQELDTQVMEGLRDFIDDLEQCRYTSYMDIYEAYDILYDRLRELQDIGELNPRNFLFRCWEWIKKMFSFLRPVLAGVVLITALGFLIYTVTNPTTTPGSGSSSIEAIGTVKAE
ncbi:MAG: hypothetical protein LBH09_07665 [Peptococcaceae bacterium]|jgi:hypothetical protein|nr:hypothetical protein [Peptococcaceae bacterium]